MASRIKFGRNWNGKLDRDLFTTIRAPKPYYYKDDQIYDIYLREKLYCKAKIIASRYIPINDIDDIIARQDIGDTAEKLKLILRNMHKITPDKNPPMMLLCLLKVYD